MDDREAAYQLLSVAQSYAPTGKEQNQLSKIFNSIPSDREKILAMAGILTDGLRYGNWPWTPPRTTVPGCQDVQKGAKG